MPIYFSDVAPTCPTSSDSPTGPRQAYVFTHKLFARTTIPAATDLKSALLAANTARSIVSSTVNNTVKNNVYPAKGGGKMSIGKDKFKNTTARWVEQKDKRVKKKYKYYGKDDQGNDDKKTYVMTERIERMVWYDKAWKSYMIWEYGDKGEGDPVK
jgi:hypothetical protein